jgi:cobaltochelatase CobT
VARHEQAGAAVFGVGVGLDLSPYYRRCHVLDLSKAVTMAVFREVIGMIRKQ